MTASNITFIGGTEGNVQSFNWGGLDFALNTPVLVDPEAAADPELRKHYEYMIVKAKTHPYLTIEDAPPVLPLAKKSGGATARQPADDDYSENGDTTIPDDWRDMHHTRMIALARRLGGGDDIATRDAAATYIEACLKEQGRDA